MSADRNRPASAHATTSPSLLDSSVLFPLRDSERILIAGAGGGFDLLSGLPIAFALHERDKTVFLANLTFTAATRTTAKPVAPGVFEVDADTEGQSHYFPEKPATSAAPPGCTPPRSTPCQLTDIGSTRAPVRRSTLSGNG
ncbi:hypothetical protein [Gordonia aichiensis]